MNKYKNMVKGKAKSMFILGADKEDIIQEGMIGLFKAVRDFDPGRDADDGAAVAGGIAHGDGRFKAGDKALEGVGAGVGDGAEGGDVLEKSAHEPMRLTA